MTSFIFDLDGTLVESLPAIAKSLNLALEEHKLPTYSQSKVIEFIGNGSRDLCQKAAPDANHTEIDSIETSFKKHYNLFWRTGTKPFEGITELLNLLQEHKIPIAVLSNKPHSFTVDIVKSVFPNITFNNVTGQIPEIKKKPDPSGANTIIKSLGNTGPCYIVGDSSVDIATAQNANIGSVAVSWGYEDQSQLKEATHYVQSVGQLQQLLLSLAEI